MTGAGFGAFAAKMKAADVPQVAIDTFAHYYDRLASGETGMIPESEIAAVGSLPALDDLRDAAAPGADVWNAAVVIKLNGGLGTSMGMSQAKSLLPIKDGLTFLDIIARQVLGLRRTYDCRLPLVLMDSFRTSADSLALLSAYPQLDSGVPLDFLQHKVPKVLASDLSPATWPADPELEWAPPGHGDLYPALVTSGMLESLIDAGFKYAFVSNSDNLGAVLDPSILGWFASERIPFLMEVAERTAADRKGGHLAVRKADGRLILREIAQCPDTDKEAFANTDRYRFFNTNTLWVNLDHLHDVLSTGSGVLPLPLIRNKKTVDPSDPASPDVYQIETAMGAAIGVFEGARALRVPRTRFAPVKTTNDLLGLRSDAYVLAGDDHLELSPERSRGPLFVDLDPGHYKLIGDLESRFPTGPPSLVDCERFVVRGDVSFGANVVAHGDVSVSPESDGASIADGTVLTG